MDALADARRMNCGLLRITVAAPGTGKTTWCRAQLREGRLGARLSLDDARARIGDHAHDQTITAEAVQSVRSAARSILAVGDEVTIDATSTTRGERAGWLDLAAQRGATTEAVLLRAPLAVVLARNAARARPVPDVVVREMWHRAVLLTRADLICEGFDTAVEVSTTTEGA